MPAHTKKQQSFISGIHQNLIHNSSTVFRDFQFLDPRELRPIFHQIFFKKNNLDVKTSLNKQIVCNNLYKEMMAIHSFAKVLFQVFSTTAEMT